MQNVSIDLEELRELHPDYSDENLYDLASKMNQEFPTVPTGGTNPQAASQDSISQPEAMPSQTPQASAVPENPNQKAIDYIIKKYGLDRYTPERRDELVQNTYQADQPPNYVAAAGALGAGLSGFNPIHEGLHLLDRRHEANQTSLNAFDKGREQSIQNFGLGNQIEDRAKAQALAQRENDPNSDESKLAQELAIRLGVNPLIAKKLTAAQFKAFSPAYLKMYEASKKPSVGTTKIDTVDEKGNPVTKLVENKPGQSFPARPKEPSVSSAVATQLGEYDAALKMVNDLERSYVKNASKPFSSLGRWVNGKNANLYMDQVKLTAQNVGRVLEGGKLTDADFDRYIERFGLPSDENNKARNKFNKMREQIKIKRDATIKAQGQAGYNSSNFSPKKDDLLNELKQKAKNGDAEAKAYLESIGE